MRILIADNSPETALAAFTSGGAPCRRHHLGASTGRAQQSSADEVVRLLGASAGQRLLNGVHGVPEAVPDPRFDAAVRS